MELAKVNDDGTITWPYYLKTLKAENKNVSFPKDSEIDADFLEQWNVYVVQPSEKPSYNEQTEYLENTTPTKTDTGVYQSWAVRYINLEALEKDIRGTRNTLLQQSDVHILRAYEAGETPPADWVAYRTALRDIPAQEGFPTNVTWPTQPS